MMVIYAGNLYPQSIVSAGIERPGAAIKAMDRDLQRFQLTNRLVISAD